MEDNIPKSIDEAINDPGVPKIYSNSFSCALGVGDVAILFKNSKKNATVLNLSYTTGKTLAIKLLGLINHLETKSGNKIMTTDDVAKALQPTKNDAKTDVKEDSQ